MSRCKCECTKAKCLVAPNRCDENQILRIKTVDENTDFNVYIENTESDLLKAFDIRSNAEGEINLALNSLWDLLVENTVYRIWVTEKDAAITDIIEVIQNDTTIIKCFEVEFKHVYNNDEDLRIRISLPLQELVHDIH